MFEDFASSEWAGLVFLILLWMFIVGLALWTLDQLFPRIERSQDDRIDPHAPRSPLSVGSMRSGVVGAAEAPGQRQRPSPYSSATVPYAPPRDGPLPAIPVPPWLMDYWRATIKLILPLLAIWLASVLLPTLLAPLLHRFPVFTRFPLAYLLNAQVTLILFVALIFVYAWRTARLDQRYALDPVLRDEEDYHRYGRLLRMHRTFILACLGFVLLMGLAEFALRLPPRLIHWIFVGVTLGVSVVIGVRVRAHTPDEYYVAGRRVPGLFNGLATGSEWISGAAFVSLAGALWLLGYEGLAYIVGWAGGYVLLALLLAPYLRKSRQHTIPDFIALRYDSMLARIIAAVSSIVISFVYMTAQIIGIGIMLRHFLGIYYPLGVVIGLAAVLFCTLLGGMQSATWTQVAQGLILLIAYLIPIVWLAFQLTGVPLPQVVYGEALRHVAELEAVQGITPDYMTPFNDWTIWNFLALVFCLMLGTASMPHILIRSYTTSTVRESRSSVGWALLLIVLIYLTVPAYAAFARQEILQNVVGQPVTHLPAWVDQWARTTFLTISDAPAQGGNGDGIVQFSEVVIDQDLVVLATPDIAGMPQTIVALLVAGGLAAALSTASGLLLVIASAAVHDIYYRGVLAHTPARERLFLVRGVVLLVAVLVALTALPRIGIIVQMVAWAFSFAAAIFFPVLVLGIFWKGATSYGAVAGMLSGMLVTGGYLALNYLYPEINLLEINHTAAGIFGVPVNFFMTWVISRLGPYPTPQAQSLVDKLRHP